MEETNTNIEFKEYDENEQLEKQNTLMYINKNEFLNKPTKVKLKGAFKDQFNKRGIKIMLQDNSEYLLRINNTTWNSLIEYFGKSILSWIDKEIIISSSEDDYEIEGKLVKGYKIKIEYEL